MAFKATGKIIAGGRTLKRLLPSGILDTNFNEGDHFQVLYLKVGTDDSIWVKDALGRSKRVDPDGSRHWTMSNFTDSLEPLPDGSMLYPDAFGIIRIHTNGGWNIYYQTNISMTTALARRPDGAIAFNQHDRILVLDSNLATTYHAKINFSSRQTVLPITMAFHGTNNLLIGGYDLALTDNFNYNFIRLNIDLLPQLSILHTVSNTFTLQWPSTAAHYILEASVAGGWTSLTNNLTNLAGTNTFTVPNDHPSAFFRLRRPQQ